MDEPTSRAWSRPELIVLVRGKAEESVLWFCKQPQSGTGSSGLYGGCFAGSGCEFVCQNTAGS